MDDKARFQDTLTQLERHLYDYKNCFPKNVWQLLSTDVPIITLIVFAYIIIKLIGFCVWSMIIIGILIIAMIIILVDKGSKSAWKKLILKRGNYEKDLQTIKEKIKEIDIEDFKQYPDVNNYLNTFNSEIRKETERKQNIRNQYHTIIIGIYSILLIAILLTFKIDFRIANKVVVGNISYDGRIFNSLHITYEQPIATIKPLSDETSELIREFVPGSKSKNLCLFFEETKHSAKFVSYMPTFVKDIGYNDVAIIITDTTGHPVSYLPFFSFAPMNRNYEKGLIHSRNIAEIYEENHPYEILRRVKYLQENADNLRYVIEKYLLY